MDVPGQAAPGLELGRGPRGQPLADVFADRQCVGRRHEGGRGGCAPEEPVVADDGPLSEGRYARLRAQRQWALLHHHADKGVRFEYAPGDEGHLVGPPRYSLESAAPDDQDSTTA